MIIKCKNVNLNIFNSTKWDTIVLTGDEQTNVRGKPLPYLLKTIDLFKKYTAGKIILEIGSIRKEMNHEITCFNRECCNDGHSTYFWKEYTDASIHTVDINSKCKDIIETDYRLKYVTAYTQDAIIFGKNFNNLIDLLFLDAWDVVPDTEYAERHLEMYEIIKPKLSDNCLILIDDTDILNGGKGELLFEVLLRDGYDLIFYGRQALFKKDNFKEVLYTGSAITRREINNITHLFLNKNNHMFPIILSTEDDVQLHKKKNVITHDLKDSSFFFKVTKNAITIILYNKEFIYKWAV